MFRVSLIVILFIVMILLVNLPEAPQWPSWLAHNPFISYMLKERAWVKGRAAAITLNDLMPKSYDDLIAFQQEGGQEKEKHSLNQYLIYYQKVVEYLPQSAVAYGTLGFCYFHQGDYDKSMVFYQKAVALAPYFFWFHYNLGALHFAKGNYEEATRSFQTALKTDFETSLQFFYRSKIYTDFFRGHEDFNNTLSEGLKMGYRQSQRMLVLSNYYRENPRLPRSRIISPRLF